MKLKLKKDESNQWAFVETYDSKYVYNGKGTVKAVMSFGLKEEVDGSVSITALPYKYSEGSFSPLSTVVSRWGLERWMSAKKPIYSSLSNPLVIKFFAKYSTATGNYLSTLSSYEVYRPNLGLSTETELGVVKVHEISEELDSLIRQTMDYLFSDGPLNRVKVLEKRMELG